MPGWAVTAGPRCCPRCCSSHELNRKHDIPDGLMPAGKFTWWRLRRVLGPESFPAGSGLLAVAAEVFYEAEQDGSGIRPGRDALTGWTGLSRASIERAFARLAGAGLIYKAFDALGAGRGRTEGGRSAVWELTMRAEHEALLEKAGYSLEWRGQEDGSARKYRHAKKARHLGEGSL